MSDASAGIPLSLLHGCHLAKVVSVEDPDRLARVKVRLLVLDGEGAEIWARVAVPFAGADRGALFIPDVDDEVLVTFVGGDPRFPVVIGGLWNGANNPPDQFSGSRVDRWLFQGSNGTRIAIIEDSTANRILLETPSGLKGTLTEEGSGRIKFEDAAGNSITIESAGITLQTSAKVTVNASTVQVSAASVNVDAAMSKFSGVVKCDVLQATTVIGTTYTPGAGNIW